MRTSTKAAVFAFFLVSGFCSLLYQVVWLRLAFATFGVVTPVISVVVSVFMAGLWLGTWAGGRLAEPWARRSGLPPLAFYAAAELLVALGAFAVPGLFRLGGDWLLAAGAADSGPYLLRSALAIGAALLPWCVAMGATVPFMLAQLKREQPGAGETFSFLYLANVLGALAGVLLTAVLLIEWLGLRGTLRLGAACNLALALAAAALAWRQRSRGPAPGPAASLPPADPLQAPPLFAAILFVTGFCSMGMEVVWTRLLTPVILTQVYSFALVLFTYLLGTLVGSFLYRRHAAAREQAGLAPLLGWAGAAALLPLLLNDPRLNPGVPAALFSLFPFCLGLGYLTPMLVDRASGGDARRAASAYAWNILGSILGPLLASYVLLPWLGVRASLLLLSAPFVLLLRQTLPAQRRTLALGAGAAALLLVGTLVWTFEDPQVFRTDLRIARDHTATVVALGQGRGRRLLVNGVGITHVTPITKVMAHLPALCLDRPPRRGLVICFGMGTTFRSLASWDMDVTAVELVPSVRDVFGFFYQDAAAQLARPGSRVVIDDGRRFLQRGQERYDVITLDPPPPVEAAASSLLYSEEFYALAKTRLAPDGILQQWVPGAGPATLLAMVHALRAQFPYVRMLPSFEGWGYHFLASQRPLPRLSAAEMEARLPAKARADLWEWFSRGRPRELFQVMLDGEKDVDALLAGWDRSITDDRPYNEYYLMRTLFPGLLPRLH